MLKLNSDITENLLMVRKARNKATGPWPVEIHPVNWRQDAPYPFPGDGPAMSRRIVEGLVNTCLDRLGFRPGEVDLYRLMLDAPQVNENNIAHPRAVPREFNWEGLCELMLLRSAEQVEAVNLNIGTTLAGVLDVTKVEVRTRRPCVDYAALTIKISRDTVKLNRRPFFNPEVPNSLEPRNENLANSYIALAKKLNESGKGSWVPKCAASLTCLQPQPPPGPPPQQETATTSQPLAEKSIAAGGLQNEEESRLRREDSPAARPLREDSFEQTTAASSIEEALDDADSVEEQPEIVLAIEQATQDADSVETVAKQSENIDEIERELLDVDVEDIADTSDLAGDLLSEGIDRRNEAESVVEEESAADEEEVAE